MKCRRKVKIGTVIRHSCDKTAVVLVKSLVEHPTFKKYVIRRGKFHVHDEKNAMKVGDKVEIVESRPMSKTKRWKLHSILEKAQSVQVE